MPTIPKNSHRIGQRKHFIEEVRDVHDSRPGSAKRADNIEEMHSLLGRQRGGRLVHDDQARVAGERSQYLHSLLVCGAQSTHDRVWRHSESNPDYKLLKSSTHRPLIEQPTTIGLNPEKDVLDDRSTRLKGQLLGNDGDTVGERVVRRPVVNPPTVDPDLPRISAGRAGQYPDQGRLSCAILAHKRVDSSTTDAETDLRERLQAVESLADTAKLDVHVTRPPARSK
jgi:hypothetical protein